ncbi:MAG TPA: 5-dehydro-4-deoxy-D-glucuronate isomerase [Steroidobacteraceae bacterium]|nr:5-dehydro-4-deoxy-D-glucuronate isomerase [Steroidobacteraceae bacterium]
MQTRVLHATHPRLIAHLDTQGLRDLYLVPEVFRGGEICLTYSHVERLIVGGAMPLERSIALDAPDLVRGEFLSRRELGIINVGAHGRVGTDGETWELAPREGLYVPMGTRRVRFESADAASPAKLYLVSAPAHQRFAATKIPLERRMPMKMGAAATSNERTILQYIHPEICRSSQLLMGLTALEPGSVWNTMPPHLHDRRSEVYFYFDLGRDARVFHFMGEPEETRHIVVTNEQAVVSPPWSIHMGCGSSSYAFIWAMAGENQDYKDMDAVALPSLR